VPPVGQSPDEANVAFFPGYPLAARWLGRCLGLSAPVALLVTAQLACWGFWAYVLLFLRRWRVPRGPAVAVLALLLAHPAAFYLVVGYSESLFLCATLGFLYWGGVGGRRAWALAAAHGLVMTATRLVGLGLVVCPLVAAVVAAQDKRRRLLSAALLAGVASLGGLAFFAWCQWQFGRWDLYLQTQRVGWGLVPDYLAPFRPDAYRLFLPYFGNGRVEPNEVSRLTVPLTALFAVALLALEVRWRRALPAGAWRARVALYAGAALLFGISVSGLYRQDMISMVRYGYCVHALLLLALASLATERLRSPALPAPSPAAAEALRYVLLLLVSVSVTLQALFVRTFTAGFWVA
jgi:hypothetical protein